MAERQMKLTFAHARHCNVLVTENKQQLSDNTVTQISAINCHATLSNYYTDPFRCVGACAIAEAEDVGSSHVRLIASRLICKIAQLIFCLVNHKKLHFLEGTCTWCCVGFLTLNAALTPSMNTSCTPFSVSAEHSMYLTAPMSLAHFSPCG